MSADLVRRLQGAAIGVGSLLVLLSVMALVATVVPRCTQPPHPTDLGIDAGPGDRAIDDALDGSLVHVDAELQRIAAEHHDDIARFEGTQRRKYEEVSAQGPEALARWFSDFNDSLRDAGGS